jgi:hypothetical protein
MPLDVDSVDSELPLALRRLFANVVGNAPAAQPAAPAGQPDSSNSFRAGSTAPPIPAPPPDAQPAPPDAQPAPAGNFFAGASSRPNVPAPANAQPEAPQMSSNPGLDTLKAILTGRPTQPQPQRPAMTTPSGQMVPGLTKAQKLGVLLKDGILGAMAGRAANEEAIVQSGGRRSGGAGLGFVAGYNAPAQAAATQQALQRGGLENQQLGQQVAAYPANLALSQGKTISDILKSRAEATKDTAEGEKATAETGAIPTKTALEAAQAEAANFKEDPNLGLIDLRTRQPISDAAAAPLTAEEADVLGKNEGDRVPLKLKNTANEIVNRGYSTVNTEQGVYEHKRGTTGPGQRLGNNPREISLDTPVGALDNSTGKQVMVTRKDIIGNPGRYAPTSADVSTPVIKQTLKEYASTKPGTAGGTTVAVNTSIAHLGLLYNLIGELGNTNMKVFNSLRQTWKTQTGNPIGASFDEVKQAVSGELTKVTGSLSQGEQEAIKGPLDKANSPQSLRGAVRSAVQIMDGKINALHQHYVDIMHEEPDSPLIYPEAQKVRDRLLGSGGTGATSGGHVIALGGKQYQYNGSGDTADLKSYTEIKTPIKAPQ